MNNNPTQITVVMFGDSITEDGDWSRILNRKDIRNSGYSGYTTYHLIEIVNDAVIRYNPKICFVKGGINDLFSDIPIEQIAVNIEEIVDALKKNRISVVVQSTLHVFGDTWINQQVEKLNKLLQDIAVKNNCMFLDLNKRLSMDGQLKQEFSNDGVHLKPEAYIPWAEEVTRVLEELNI